MPVNSVSSSIGPASARLAGMRVAISWRMSRPLSLVPKSSVKSRSERS